MKFKVIFHQIGPLFLKDEMIFKNDLHPLIIYAKKLHLNCLNTPLCLMKRFSEKIMFIRLSQKDGDSFSLCVFLTMVVSFISRALMTISHSNRCVTIITLLRSQNRFSLLANCSEMLDSLSDYCSF